MDRCIAGFPRLETSFTAMASQTTQSEPLGCFSAQHLNARSWGFAAPLFIYQFCPEWNWNGIYVYFSRNGALFRVRAVFCSDTQKKMQQNQPAEVKTLSSHGLEFNNKAVFLKWLF